MSSKTKKILGAVVALAVVGSVVGFSVSKENRSKVTVQTGKAEKKESLDLSSSYLAFLDEETRLRDDGGPGGGAVNGG